VKQLHEEEGDKTKNSLISDILTMEKKVPDSSKDNLIRKLDKIESPNAS